MISDVKSCVNVLHENLQFKVYKWIYGFVKRREEELVKVQQDQFQLYKHD